MPTGDPRQGPPWGSWFQQEYRRLLPLCTLCALAVVVVLGLLTLLATGKVSPEHWGQLETPVKASGVALVLVPLVLLAGLAGGRGKS